MRQKKRIFTFTSNADDEIWWSSVSFYVCLSLSLPFSTSNFDDLHKKRNDTRRSFPIPIRIRNRIRINLNTRCDCFAWGHLLLYLFFVVIRVAVVVVVGAAHAHSWRCCCCCWERRRSRNEPVAGCEANEMRATVLRAVELSAQNAVAAGVAVAVAVAT